MMCPGKKDKKTISAIVMGASRGGSDVSCMWQETELINSSLLIFSYPSFSTNDVKSHDSVTKEYIKPARPRTPFSSSKSYAIAPIIRRCNIKSA